MKDKEKQIEEMVNVMCENCNERTGFCFYTKKPCEDVIIDAESLYNEGYRNVTDIFKVIFENIVYNDDAGFDVLTKDRAKELAKQLMLK